MSVEAICDLLRRNDAETTSLNTERGHQENRLVGEALRGNTHVTSLDVNVDNFFAEDVKQRFRDPSNAESQLQRAKECAEHFLQYLRESRELRVARFVDNGDNVCYDWNEPEVNGHLVSLFVQAIAENDNSTIHELFFLRWDFVNKSREFVSHLLTTTRSLQRLTIRLSENSQSEWLGESLRSNSSLQYLTLQGGSYGRDDMDSEVAGILSGLDSHPSLQELVVRCPGVGGLRCPGVGGSPDAVEALARVVASMELLTTLDLDIFNFGDGLLECLVEGLIQNRSLTKLSIGPNCDMDGNDDAIVPYLESVIERPRLRELVYSMGCKRLAESLVTVPRIESDPFQTSVGSMLQSLCIRPTSDFFHAFSANASVIHLKRLVVSIRDDTIEPLLQCIPSLVRLQELVIKDFLYMQDGCWISSLAAALKSNGSLLEVLYPARYSELDKVKVYCERNREISALLSWPLPATSSMISEPEATDGTSMSLFPTLFCAAWTARRMAPQTLLIGLLSSLDSIGPRHDSKRLVAD
jgi:hypothetical protein